MPDYRSPAILGPDFEEGWLPDWLGGGEEPPVLPGELPAIPPVEPPPELPAPPPPPPLPTQEKKTDWMPIAIVASALIAAGAAIFWSD